MMNLEIVCSLLFFHYFPALNNRMIIFISLSICCCCSMHIAHIFFFIKFHQGTLHKTSRNIEYIISNNK